jgi:predicted ATPase
VRDKNGISRLWENIHAWLQYISPGTELSYDIKREQNASYPYYNGILPTETGYGLSYILPIITALLIPGSVIKLLLLENPEAHLHPKGQTAIGELIVLAASTGKQVIVETHSDHLIDGIRIAVRKEKIKYSDVVFHYLSKEDYESETKIETPELQQDGKLSFWPKGFFDQSILNKAELLKSGL